MANGKNEVSSRWCLWYSDDFIFISDVHINESFLKTEVGDKLDSISWNSLV